VLTFAPQPCPPSEKTAILSPSKMLKLASEKHFISLQKVIENSKMLGREGELHDNYKRVEITKRRL